MGYVLVRIYFLQTPQTGIQVFPKMGSVSGFQELAQQSPRSKRSTAFWVCSGARPQAWEMPLTDNAGDWDLKSHQETPSRQVSWCTVCKTALDFSKLLCVPSNTMQDTFCLFWWAPVDKDYCANSAEQGEIIDQGFLPTLQPHRKIFVKDVISEYLPFAK